MSSASLKHVLPLRQQYWFGACSSPALTSLFVVLVVCHFVVVVVLCLFVFLPPAGMVPEWASRLAVDVRVLDFRSLVLRSV